MIDKGCLYHVVRPKNLKCYTHPIELVPVVRELPKVLRDDLSGVPPEWEIVFDIELLPDTNYI